MYCFRVNSVEIGKGKCEENRAERLIPNYFIAGDPHSFQHIENTGIFQGKFTEVEAITSNVMLFSITAFKTFEYFSALFFTLSFSALDSHLLSFFFSKTE